MPHKPPGQGLYDVCTRLHFPPFPHNLPPLSYRCFSIAIFHIEVEAGGILILVKYMYSIKQGLKLRLCANLFGSHPHSLCGVLALG